MIESVRNIIALMIVFQFLNCYIVFSERDIILEKFKDGEIPILDIVKGIFMFFLPISVAIVLMREIL